MEIEIKKMFPSRRVGVYLDGNLITDFPDYQSAAEFTKKRFTLSNQQLDEIDYDDGNHEQDS